MRTSFAVIAALFASTAAVKLEQKNAAVGIFSKLMEQEQAVINAENEIKEAREAKRLQLIEAEKEHEKAVADEEKEEAEKQAKEQEEMEARMEEKKRQDQLKAHEALFKQVMDEQNLQMDNRVRIITPKKRHNADHAADLMLINLSIQDEKPAEAAAGDSAKAKGPAAAGSQATGAATASTAAATSESDPKKIMADFNAAKEKAEKSKKPAEVVDPRFTPNQDDKYSPSEQTPAINSPGDVYPYYKAINALRNDKMPGSDEIQINFKTGATMSPVPVDTFPKYDYNAKPKWHARPIKDSRYYEGPQPVAPAEIPVFDKSGRLLEGDEAAAFRKAKQSVVAVVEDEETKKAAEQAAQEQRDAAKVKAFSDAMEVKTNISVKGDRA